MLVWFNGQKMKLINKKCDWTNNEHRLGDILAFNILQIGKYWKLIFNITSGINDRFSLPAWRGSGTMNIENGQKMIWICLNWFQKLLKLLYKSLPVLMSAQDLVQRTYAATFDTSSSSGSPSSTASCTADTVDSSSSCCAGCGAKAPLAPRQEAMKVRRRWPRAPRLDVPMITWRIWDNHWRSWDNHKTIWDTYWEIIIFCLVVYLPLWKIWVRQLGWWFSMYGTIKNVPNHQPARCSHQNGVLWICLNILNAEIRGNL